MSPAVFPAVFDRVHQDAAQHCPRADELPINCRRVLSRLDRLGVTNPAAHAGLLVPKLSSMTLSSITHSSIPQQHMVPIGVGGSIGLLSYD
jgi:hypothetical protein